MDTLKWLKDNWDLVVTNGWAFASVAVLVFSLAWLVIHFLYKHRIDGLREENDRLKNKIADLKEALAAPANTSSPPTVVPSSLIETVSLPLPLPSVAAPVSASPKGAYDYPDSGDHGMNILGQALTNVVVDGTYSMTATVPAGNVLRVELSGDFPSPPSPGGMPGGWGYGVSTRNWQGGSYDQDAHTQWFTARSGDAELAFKPWRAGAITLRAFEGHARNPVWTKVLKVTAPNGH